MRKFLFPLLAVVLAIGLALPMSTPVAAVDTPIVYGVQRETGEIWQINPIDGSPTLVFTAPIPPNRSSSSPNGLAYDSDNNRLYYTQYPGTAQLYFYDGTIQQSAGALTGVIACADFYAGKYYYISSATDDLYEVTFDANGFKASDTKIADITSNAHSWTFDGDIAISPEGKLYGFGKCGIHGQYEFFSVDLDGQNFALIKDNGYTFSLQLAFSPDGTLYGHASSGVGYFYTVALDSGVPTLLPLSGKSKLYTDLASGPRITEPETYSICGFKYDDSEGGEIALPGWEIELYKSDGEGGWTPQATITTDENGAYCFTGLEGGDYRVSETLEEGWDQVSPAGNEYLITLPGAAYDPETKYNFYNTPAEIDISIDIKPTSCPNPLNVCSKNVCSKNVVSVAILGTKDFDVTRVDPSTVELVGVAPLRWSFEDVATPFEGEVKDCLSCTTKGPDGYNDLVFKFDQQELVTAIGEVEDGECLELTLAGVLLDGTAFLGSDFVTIIAKCKCEKPNTTCKCNKPKTTPRKIFWNYNKHQTQFMHHSFKGKGGANPSGKGKNKW
jgi:sugar lactone lactonase YvrE